MTASRELRRTIHEIMTTTLDRDIDPTVDVFDQGATSLAFIRAVARIGEAYDIAVDVGELEEASVDALAELLARQLGTSALATAEV